MFQQQDKTVPGLNEARYVQGKIKQLGVQDVELFWDAELSMWGVYQVRKSTSTFLVPDRKDDVGHLLMFWCKNEKSEYRVPNDSDIQSVIATVNRAQETFKRGGDWLADQLDSEDDAKRARKEAKHKERIAPHLKRLKKAVREELG